MTKTFLVRGCGVSLICQQGDTMMGWIRYIVDRGGVPDVQVFENGESR